MNLIDHDNAKLPSYLANAFQDLYEEDGLFVCGRGMGLLHLIASFCRFYVDKEEGHLALVQEELETEREKVQSQSQLQQSRASANKTGYITDQQRQRNLKYIESIQREIKSRQPLIFVIGLRDYERKCLISILERWGAPTHLLPTEITNESGQGKDRSVLYAKGGVFLITSRILIVDLLTHVASPRIIDGILVAHAENISEQSTEAFILRIYKTQKCTMYNRSMTSSSSYNNVCTNNNNNNSATLLNDDSNLANNPIIQSQQNGFIKAFSDNPDALMSGFAKVDKILKALYVRRLYIYPRFHELVIEDLERTPPIVEELHQTLSPRMRDIQTSIAAAVVECIRQIKKDITLIDWTEADLTLENCVTTNFDLRISHQLEADWHRIKPQTKQLVHDLRQLRSLFQHLLQYDCIAFWRLLNNIRKAGLASRHEPKWLGTKSGERIFDIAKERLYIIEKGRETSKNPNPLDKLIPILEENPKWRLLHQVLSEIKNRHEIEIKATRSKHCSKAECRVLVMVNDERTLESVRSYLIDGKEKTMKKRWLRYLKSINDRSRALAKSAGGSLPQEQRLLLEEEGKIRNFLYGPASKEDHRTHPSTSKDGSSDTKRKVNNLNTVPTWKKKRRKIQEEQSRGDVLLESVLDRQQKSILDDAVEEAEHYDIEILSKSTHFQDDKPATKGGDQDNEKNLYHVEQINDLRVVIQTYSSSEGEQAYLLLNDIKPKYIVLYDTEPSFIRTIELHSASCHNNDFKGRVIEDRLRIYFMLFEKSSEEKNYLKALEREQNAFQKLIQHKKTMALPVNMMGPWTTQEMQLANISGVAGSYNSGSLPLSMDTRTGRGKRMNAEKRDIAVDVREFRSALPSILHQGGMRLAPVTLTVGDFVLSNVHCVERKSISDLFGSFASGRLFNQAETMCKHYKCPSLLIEFNPTKTFCLQNVNEIGPDLRSDSVCSKMALLMMHFPKLRLLWSKSPHETLKLFKILKMNHEEVDVDNAVAVGSNESIDALLLDDDNNGGPCDQKADEKRTVDINEAGKDMLLQLPGITIHNARKVMNSCDSIAELACLSRERMKEILGPLAGQRLFTFFHQRSEK